MHTHSLEVDEQNKGLRLDVFLAQNLPDASSRSFVKKLIDAGEVLVNGKKAKANYQTAAGDIIETGAPEFLDDTIKPENIPLDILYEDEVLIAVNKPSGMMVHPASGVYTGTLVNALLYHTKILSEFNEPFRPGIVHRLDRETSGIILVAKTNSAHALLAKQFEKHTIQKRYAALVEGLVEFDEGFIDAPLGRHPRQRDKKAVVFYEAKEAQTRYRVLKRGKNQTLVRLFPETGRTHQLRVHMAYLKHPILGDEKYGKKILFPRLALHAQSIGFSHPKTSAHMEFNVKIPPEFLSAVSAQQ